LADDETADETVAAGGFGFEDENISCAEDILADDDIFDIVFAGSPRDNEEEVLGA